MGPISWEMGFLQVLLHLVVSQIITGSRYGRVLQYIAIRFSRNGNGCSYSVIDHFRKSHEQVRIVSSTISNSVISLSKKQNNLQSVWYWHWEYHKFQPVARETIRKQEVPVHASAKFFISGLIHIVCILWLWSKIIVIVVFITCISISDLIDTI